MHRMVAAPGVFRHQQHWGGRGSGSSSGNDGNSGSRSSSGRERSGSGTETNGRARAPHLGSVQAVRSLEPFWP